jgi:hypothetical protein
VCHEASSSPQRLAPSTGASKCSNGIPRPARCPRKYKNEPKHRKRGSRSYPQARDFVTRFVGIDIAAETHCVAIVDEEGKVLLKPTPFKESSTGYERLPSVPTYLETPTPLN